MTQDFARLGSRLFSFGLGRQSTSVEANHMLTKLFVLSSLAGSIAYGDERIIGGDPTEDFAAVGTMVAIDDEGYILADFCSGTLIRADVVLTAAHCIEAIDDLMQQGATDIVFVFGTSLYEDDGVWDYAYVTGAVMHEAYDEGSLDNDIGLLQLEEAVTTVSPMPMNTTTPALDRQVTYVGWGLTDQDDNYSSGVKMTVSVPVYDMDETRIYTHDPGGRNICSGDSGGAALMPNATGDYILVGVNSFGFDVNGGEPNCEGAGAAGGVVRVDAYLDWIEGRVGSAPEVDPGPNISSGQQSTNRPNRHVVRTEMSCSTAPMGSGLGLSLLALLGLARRRRG
jgi:MYXO-CTERM domain-containing protein